MENFDFLTPPTGPEDMPAELNPLEFLDPADAVDPAPPAAAAAPEPEPVESVESIEARAEAEADRIWIKFWQKNGDPEGVREDLEYLERKAKILKGAELVAFVKKFKEKRLVLINSLDEYKSLMRAHQEKKASQLALLALEKNAERLEKVNESGEEQDQKRAAAYAKLYPPA